jgi:uncharacterized membrane protein YjfL (UPF0719 family)
MHFYKSFILSALLFSALPSKATDYNTYLFIDTVANSISLSTAKTILATTCGIFCGLVHADNLNRAQCKKNRTHIDFIDSMSFEEINILSGAFTGLFILPQLVNEESHEAAQYMVKGSAAIAVSIPTYFITKATWRRIKTYIKTILHTKSDI